MDSAAEVTRKRKRVGAFCFFVCLVINFSYSPWCLTVLFWELLRSFRHRARKPEPSARSRNFLPEPQSTETEQAQAHAGKHKEVYPEVSESRAPQHDGALQLDIVGG